MSKIKVIVQNSTGLIWSGEGDNCSMINSLGPFDILAEHTQFVTPIQGDIIVRDSTQIIWQHSLVTSALCRVKNNQVEIWIGV